MKWDVIEYLTGAKRWMIRFAWLPVRLSKVIGHTSDFQVYEKIWLEHYYSHEEYRIDWGSLKWVSTQKTQTLPDGAYCKNR